MISLKDIEEKTVWVAKMTWGRQVGTDAEVGHLFHSDECRDYDICGKQPEELKPFYDKYFAYCDENGFITIPEFYKDIYLVDIQEEVKPKRIWTEDEIKNYIQTNDEVLYLALKKLYAEQTADEQNAGETKERNEVGFNGVDASFLSSVAQFLIKNGFLTDKQKLYVRKKLVKYNKQLTRLANA